MEGGEQSDERHSRQQKLKSPPHSTRSGLAQPVKAKKKMRVPLDRKGVANALSQFWPVGQHPVTPLSVVQIFPASQQVPSMGVNE